MPLAQAVLEACLRVLRILGPAPPPFKRGPLCRTTQKLWRSMLRGRRGAGWILPPKWFRRYLQRVLLVLPDLYPGADDEDPNEVAILAALALVRPDGEAWPPPPRLRKRVRRMLDASMRGAARAGTKIDPLDLVPDLVVALLNGWRRGRRFRADSAGWDGRPVAARLAFWAWVLRCVQGSRMLIRSIGQQVPGKSPPDLLWDGTIDCLGWLLGEDRCRCMDHLEDPTPARLLQRARTHALQHELAAWLPFLVPLCLFVARAVCGSLARKLDFPKTSGQPSGMLWSSIGWQIDPARLHLGTILVNVCPLCGAETPYDRCGTPGCAMGAFGPGVCRKLLKRQVFLDPPFRRRPSRACWECGSINPAAGFTTCPQCGTGPTPPGLGRQFPRLRNVWWYDPDHPPTGWFSDITPEPEDHPGEAPDGEDDEPGEGVGA